MTDNTALYTALSNQHTTSAYGPRSGGFHHGRDSRALRPTTVYGAGSGKVLAVYENHPVYGKRIETEYMVGGIRIIVGLAHLSRIDVKEGQPVTLLTVMGATGTTPKVDPHLHEDTRVNGVETDPALVLNDRSTIPAGGNTVPIQKEPAMKFKTDENGNKFVYTEVGGVKVAPATADLCFEVENAPNGITTAAKLAVYDGVLAAINQLSNKGVSAVVDNTKVLEALAALDKQADEYQSAMLAAIASVDENTLATFGLKRI